MKNKTNYRVKKMLHVTFNLANSTADVISDLSCKVMKTTDFKFIYFNTFN